MSLSDHMFSDATRQAWRDNYNGGRAAGDFAGVYSNPGGSRDYSVSSGQTAGDGNDRSDGTAKVSRGAASVPTSGPGASAVVTGGRTVRTRGPGAFSFSGAPVARVTVSDLAPLEMGHKDSGTNIMFGGDWWQGNPWVSDTEEFEARYGEPGDWVGGILVFGADLAFNVGRAVDAMSGSRITDPNRHAQFNVDELTSRPGALPQLQSWLEDTGAAFAREGDRIGGIAGDALGFDYSPDPSRY